MESSELTLKSLRAKFMNSTDWLKKVPYEIRDSALRDFDKAPKAFFAKRRKVKATNPDAVVTATFQFKSRHKKQQCFVMRGRDWGRTRGVYSSLFGVDKITSSEPIPGLLETEFRIVVDRLGHYFLCIPQSIPIRSDNQAPKSGEGVVSLHPGIRTFQTCYSTDGLVTEWGKDDMQKLFQDCYAADRLQGRLAKAKGVKHRRRHKAWIRKLLRISHKGN